MPNSMTRRSEALVQSRAEGRGMIMSISGAVPS
jgi:hypothetical protein